MTDNITLPGTGVVTAADGGTGVYYQRVKIANGAAGATDLIGGDAANGLDVDVTRLPALPAGANTIGSVKVADSGKTLLIIKAAIAASQTGAAILTPTSGKKWVLKRMYLSAITAGSVWFFDNTDTATTAIGPTFQVAVASQVDIGWDTDTPRRSAAVNNVLKYSSGTVVTGSVTFEYWEE